MARRWGGGLELALHCHYRTISGGAFVAFPEVFLGLVPGWGGTQLLPNLIGIDAAVTVIVDNALAQNKVTPGPKAAKLGIAAAVFEPADFLERSLEWAAGVLDGDVTVARPEADRSAWDDAIARARAVVAARTPPRARPLGRGGRDRPPPRGRRAPPPHRLPGRPARGRVARPRPSRGG